MKALRGKNTSPVYYLFNQKILKECDLNKDVNVIQKIKFRNLNRLSDIIENL